MGKEYKKLSTQGASPSSYIMEAFERLANNKKTSLDTYLHEVVCTETIDQTEVFSHVYCLKLDGNGRPRTNDFLSSILDHMIDYCIPRSKIKQAHDHYQETMQTSKITRLHREAKGLFTDAANTGEGGELLVFVLAEQHLRLPQLMCKMSLKTSSKVHFHGSDGLYAGVDKNTGAFCLYWGESKIHKTAAKAINDCFVSIAPLLSGKGGSGAAERRDLQLLHREVDFGDPNLEQALRRYLDPDDIMFNEVEFRGICLVGFDCSTYPGTGGGKKLSEIVDEIKPLVTNWKKLAATHCSKNQLSKIHIHLFCLPLPSANDFRTQFLKELEAL